MTTIAKGRARPRLVKLAAGAILAGTAMSAVGVGVASAAVTAPNVTTVAYNSGVLTVDWTPGAAGDEVTYWRVSYDRTDAAGGDANRFFSRSTTIDQGFAAVPGATYAIRVCANDEVTESCSTPAVTITIPAAPVGCSLSTWTPFCTVEAEIQQMYRDWIGRSARFDEMSFWREQLSADPNRETAFIESLRLNPLNDPITGSVVRLYTAYFLRLPDYAGFRFWQSARTAGWSIDDVSSFFASSPEFQNTYGSLDNGDFVALVYRNVLGRLPDAAGYAYWLDQLNAGLSRGRMMLLFSDSPEYSGAVFYGETPFRFVNAPIAVVTSQAYAALLRRMPTLEEYDAWTRNGTVAAIDPRNAASVQAAMKVIYEHIMSSREYSLRIDNGSGS